MPKGNEETNNYFPFLHQFLIRILNIPFSKRNTHEKLNKFKAKVGLNFEYLIFH